MKELIIHPVVYEHLCEILNVPIYGSQRSQWSSRASQRFSDVGVKPRLTCKLTLWLGPRFSWSHNIPNKLGCHCIHVVNTYTVSISGLHTIQGVIFRGGLHLYYHDNNELNICTRHVFISQGCTPSYILHTRAFGTYILGGLFTLQKRYKVMVFYT